MIITNRGEMAGHTILEDLGIVSASMAPPKFIFKN